MNCLPTGTLLWPRALLGPAVMAPPFGSPTTSEDGVVEPLPSGVSTIVWPLTAAEICSVIDPNSQSVSLAVEETQV